MPGTWLGVFGLNLDAADMSKYEKGCIILVENKTTSQEIVIMSTSQNQSEQPAYVAALEEQYGGASSEGSGSAVFFLRVVPGMDLEPLARACYQHFLGWLWERRGEAMFAEWREVWRREADSAESGGGILDGLRQSGNFFVEMQLEQLIDNQDSPDDAQAAISLAFDDAAVSDARAYYLGDDDIWSGILLGGQRANGETTFLIFLCD